MGHSYIEAHGETLRFPDRDIELSIYLLEGALKRTQNPSSELQKLIGEWGGIARDYAPGTMIFELDPIKDGPVGKALLGLLKDTESWVSGFSDKIPMDLLNGLAGGDRPFAFKDLDKSLALGVIQPVIGLLSRS